jgi:hypothetical protein
MYLFRLGVVVRGIICTLMIASCPVAPPECFRRRLRTFSYFFLESVGFVLPCTFFFLFFFPSFKAFCNQVGLGDRLGMTVAFWTRFRLRDRVRWYSASSSGVGM